MASISDPWAAPSAGVAGSGAPAFDEYVSDPAKPVPFIEDIAIGMTREYMTDDQRFAARRPDVLSYTTAVLAEDVTLAGPMLADLWVSTTGTDSDWVVKVIDVHPAEEKDPPLGDATNAASRTPSRQERTRPMSNYHEMVRSEVIRGKFRDSYERPEPFEPGRPTRVRLPLQDVLHTFRKGHRIQVQVQSTWFPLVDLNPQTFVPNIFEAKEGDFVRATQRVYRGGEQATGITVGVIPTMADGPSVGKQPVPAE